MVRAFQKGEAKATSPEIARVASSIKKKDAKDFASTKHKGLPEKKVKKESFASDFRSSAEFMNTFAKLKALRKKNDKSEMATGLPNGTPMKNRRGTMQGVEEGKKPMVKVKLNPKKKIGVKVTDVGPGGKEYVRKDTMGEGTSYGLYRGDGKVKFKGFVKKAKGEDKKKKEVKEDIADIIARLEKKRISKGGDPSESPLAAMRKYHADKDKKKEVKKEEVETIDELSKTTTANYLYQAKVDRSYVHGGKMHTKEHEKARTKGIERAKKKLGDKISKKVSDDARTDSQSMSRDWSNSKYPRRYKVTKDGQKEETEVYWSSKALDQLDQLNERQKDSDNQRLSQERGRSNYGKASIRNMRHTGEGGNAADPAERLVSMDKRHKAHKEKRGVKTLSKYKKVVKEEGYDHWRDKQLEKGTWKEPERKNPPRKPMSKADRKKSQENSMKVLDMVKAGIRQKYGKGAIMGESFINEETPMQRIDRISKEKVAARAKAAAADKAKKDASAAKFQAHKKATLAKGGRPVDALDSWQKKKLNKEELLSFSQWLAEGNDRTRMMNKAKNQTTGSISADRDTKSEKDNRSNRKGLEKDLKKKGIGYKKSVGKYKYDSGETGKEVSYQTSPGKKMSKRRFGKVMRRLGRKYDQESVITKKAGKDAKLHDTTTKQNKKQPKGYKPFSLGSKVKKGKNPTGEGETSATKVRGGKMPSKTKKNSTYHYGK